jgi:glucuronokinase
MIITKRAYPRVGLIGNPSDGYFGKTIAFTFSNFYAEVLLYETPELKILPNTFDESIFTSIRDLVKNVNLYGYYGGVRLLKAAVKKFFEYAKEHHIKLHKQNFTIRYKSNIPHRVGLAGSSAIITACLKALMAFYDVMIPKPALANLILSVETEELDISAGLQDRVAQSYQGLVYMDFDESLMISQGYGHYEKLEASNLPNLYVAYMSDLSEGSEVFHNDIRSRFNSGEHDVVEAMKYWAELADQVKECIYSDDKGTIGALMNANFDKRKSLYKISQGNLDMVETARRFGASAKFTGSGGAIVGTYEDEDKFYKMQDAFKQMKVNVIKPVIINGDD